MDFELTYDIARTADFIRSRGFTRVALQFPDELLKDSTRVAKALRSEVGKGVGLYVMADTAYGSCCIDEVGASHVDADCVVHYGHACMSPTSNLPALFVFGKACIDVKVFAESICNCLSTIKKPILVLFGLEYAYAIQNIKEVMPVEILQSDVSNSMVHFAEVICSTMNPMKDGKTEKRELGPNNCVGFNGDLLKHDDSIDSEPDHLLTSGTSYSLGGLTWNVPEGRKMEDYLLFWIGSDNPAFANVVLTFNSCEIVRYHAEDNCLLKETFHQKKILMHRYYLVEKAKDANIVGILVGTLGVAGYLHMIQQMKELIARAGKKAYTLVMGRPNPAKLANFPECDVFVNISCAQTALLDSKEFLAPVITPFEAKLAFNRGSQWTGEYVVEFRDLMASTKPEADNGTTEARFSFIHGGYVEDVEPHEKGWKQEERSIVLSEMTEKALSLEKKNADSILFKGTAKSGAEFFAARSYHGLDTQYENSSPQSYVIGRTGKASGYSNEETN